MSNLDEYQTFLKSNHAESHNLASELLIGVTRFFRDEDAFEKLKREVIPQIVQANAETKSIRVWVTACSTGEEAYSIAILLNEYLRSNNLHYDVVIFATDLDKEAIRLASSRIFPESIAAEIPFDYLRSFFTAQKKGYTVIKEIREMIVFSVHNLIQDPPFGKIDLLSCRNFLIYLNSSVQSRLFNLFQYALKQNGFLFLGSSESLGQAEEQFREVSSKYKTYQNHKSKQTSGIRLGKKTLHQKPKDKTASSTVGSSDRVSKTTSNRMLQDVQEAVIQELVPDTIVFTEDFELVHTTGQVSQWLKFPRGMINTNILKMLPSQLSLSFEVLTNTVLESGDPSLLQNIPLEEDLKRLNSASQEGYLEIEIRRLNADYYSGLLAATFSVRKNKGKINTISQFEVDIKQASKEKISLLERELRANQEDLQTTIEELQAANEELQSSN